MSLRFWDSGKKIVAVARNYANHAKELGNDIPKAPIWFLKPTTSYLLPGNPIVVPSGIDLHHEVELGVVIGKKGKDIPAKNALDYILGYTLALDMTARNLQNDAKKAGLPWFKAKGMDTFCPILPQIIPKEKIPDPSNIELWLKVDGQIKQKGSTSDMIFKIPELIESASQIVTLEPGDLILTGTPEGVGPVKPNQVIEAGITGLAEIKFTVVAKPSPKL